MVEGLEGKRWLAGRVADIASLKAGRHAVLRISADGRKYLLPLSKCGCPPGHGVRFRGEELCEAEFCREFLEDVASGRVPGIRVVGSIPLPLRFLGVLREDSTHPLALYWAGGQRVVVKGYREETKHNYEPFFYYYLRGKGLTPPFKAYYEWRGSPLGLITGYLEGEDGGLKFYRSLLNSLKSGEAEAPEEEACRVARVLAGFHVAMLGCAEGWCGTAIVDAGDVESWRRRIRFYYGRIHSPILKERVEAAARGMEKYLGSLKARIHQDFHLSQLMRVGGEYFILDFEGEPGRPEAWRGELEPPLRDFASLLRSISYISFFAVKEAGSLSMEEAAETLFTDSNEMSVVRTWGRSVARILAECYLERLEELGGGGAAMSLENAEELLEIVEPWYVERGLYEAYYEAMYRKKNVVAAVSTLAAHVPL